MAIPVSITSLASFSPLGANPKDVWQSYNQKESLIKPVTIGNKSVYTAQLPPKLQEDVNRLRNLEPKYSQLDNSVLYALLASRSTIKQAGWAVGDSFGINIGSSRGATGLFEQYYEEFIRTGISSVQTSPTTTLGNISSWVAQDLKSAGPDISHSVTCSTALHAVINGVAWLRAGMADKFLAGGSEAPLTPFTIAQMQAMKIYTSLKDEYPCRAFDLDKKKNTMVLGEGAAVASLESGYKENALAYIEGLGYATETLKHSVSISANAECLQKAMKMALKDTRKDEVDVIVMHAPGTIKGDTSEYTAIQEVFGNNLPMLTTNKWKIGHTFGASGILSLELALLMIQHDTFIGIPYLHETPKKKPIQKVLINAVGFGGNAVSLLISK